MGDRGTAILVLTETEVLWATNQPWSSSNLLSFSYRRIVPCGKRLRREADHSRTYSAEGRATYYKLGIIFTQVTKCCKPWILFKGKHGDIPLHSVCKQYHGVTGGGIDTCCMPLTSLNLKVRCIKKSGTIPKPCISHNSCHSEKNITYIHKLLAKNTSTVQLVSPNRVQYRYNAHKYSEWQLLRQEPSLQPPTPQKTKSDDAKKLMLCMNN
jgi:hypothetical protein